MGLMLISWLYTFPQVVKIFNYYKISNRNITWHPGISKSEQATYQILLNLGVIFLFTLCLIACLLLIMSLWRHKRHMQSSAPGVREPSTEAHVKAMKVLISFIILLILYFIGITIEVACFSEAKNKLLFIFGMAFTIAYPCGHSFLLILGNSKLKQACLKVLRPLKS